MAHFQRGSAVDHQHEIGCASLPCFRIREALTALPYAVKSQPYKQKHWERSPWIDDTMDGIDLRAASPNQSFCSGRKSNTLARYLRFTAPPNLDPR